MKTKTLFLAIAVFLCCMPDTTAWAAASKTANAKRPRSVTSFSISCPDTVTQGVDFSVTYALTATHWDAWRGINTGAVRLRDLKHNMRRTPNGSNLEIRAKYSTSRTGQVELPPFIIPIDGKPVASDTKSIYVKPNPTYGREMDTAQEWLLSHGANADSLCLTLEMSRGSLRLFSDMEHNCFCLTAKADAWDLLQSPVLAYSLESGIYKPDNRAYSSLFEHYDKQIEALRGNGLSLPANDRHSDGKVSPLLGDLRWGQSEPYNSQSPHIENEQIVIGCVPLAMAMVMKYHNWPEQGESVVYFKIRQTNSLHRFSFDNFAPQWGTYRNRYEKKEVVEAEKLAETLGQLSLSCAPDIGKGRLGVSINAIKHLFVNNLRYSGRIHSDATSTAYDSLLRTEVDGRRPCIVSRGDHAFVCDGYDGDFFHYNLGWNGYCNGYYRLGIGKMATDVKLLETAICGIEPQREKVVKAVTSAKANTLRTLLTDEEQRNVTDLAIVGPIGSDDICLLRQMAGASDNGDAAGYPWGALQRLDLSKAKITKDKNPYRTVPATGGYKSWMQISDADGKAATDSWGKKLVWGQKNFDFATMDEVQWREFKKNVGAKMTDRIYTRTDDNKYWVSYFCQANAIGCEMFANCTSLREVILPEKLKEIGERAFLSCQSIETMTIPAKVYNVGKQPFAYCVSMRECQIPAKLYQTFDYRTKLGLGVTCSPAFKIETYR